MFSVVNSGIHVSISGPVSGRGNVTGDNCVWSELVALCARKLAVATWKLKHKSNSWGSVNAAFMHRNIVIPEK